MNKIHPVAEFSVVLICTALPEKSEVWFRLWSCQVLKNAQGRIFSNKLPKYLELTAIFLSRPIWSNLIQSDCPNVNIEFPRIYSKFWTKVWTTKWIVGLLRRASRSKKANKRTGSNFWSFITKHLANRM